MLEHVTSFIEACEGLEVSFKVGKEKSELTISGDFLAFARAGAKLAEAQSQKYKEDSEKERKDREKDQLIEELERKLRQAKEDRDLN